MFRGLRKAKKSYNLNNQIFTILQGVHIYHLKNQIHTKQ